MQPSTGEGHETPCPHRRRHIARDQHSAVRAEVRNAENRTPPNIILILADDLGYGNLGCYGQQHIQTPVLDQMAKDGLRFTHFYAGASLCLPSRCTLMTGLHTGHCRCRVNGGGGSHPPIHEEDTTLAQVLKKAGYSTGMTGKWALGDHYRGCVVGHQNDDGPGAVYKHGWDYYFGEPNQTYNGGLSAHDGTFQNNGPLAGHKGTLTEGGLRVPCIARWPGSIRPGGESDEKLAFWDFMPTFTELASIEPPSPIDGISFVPTLLESGEQMHHRYLFFASRGKNKR